MFDRHFHITDNRGPETVNVQEHRAPTDQSVRLLREMEQAARDQVVQAIRLENSPIDCVVHTQESPMSGDRDFCVFVKINGQRLEVRKSFGMFATKEEVAAGLLAAVSERIAARLLASAFAKLPLGIAP